MTYLRRVRVSYAPKLTKLERLRIVDGQFDCLAEELNVSARFWEISDKSQDKRRDACTSVLAAIVKFKVVVGIPLYAKERLNDLIVALAELHAGRHSALLSPAPVHSGKFSATDLQQQGIAQACVDALRDAGMSATDARAKVVYLFEKHHLPKFGEAKLRALNSRLRGSGSSQDEAYDLYVWAKGHFDRTAQQMGVDPIASFTTAARVADTLIALTKRRDHRRDFFFASREDSSELP